MPDISTECSLYYHNHSLAVFDDIMSTYEETLIPLQTIPDDQGYHEQKDIRIRMAELLKEPTIRKTLNDLKTAREATVKNLCIKMAAEVNDEIKSDDETQATDAEVLRMLRDLQIDQKTARAFAPLDVNIPNYNLHRTMFEWGSGGPISTQYELLSYVVKLLRKPAKTWFLERVAIYMAFRENQPRWIQSDEDVVLNGFTMNKREEDFIVASFLPKPESIVQSDKDCYAEGPSIGKVFLDLKCLTKRNQAFRSFVPKTMQINPTIRERLAAKYLYNRMLELSKKFYDTHELKYNYIRVAWERKLNYMDDYIICLILFIKDKTSNITWDEVEDIFYPKAKEILRTGFKISFDAELKILNDIIAG